MKLEKQSLKMSSSKTLTFTYFNIFIVLFIIAFGIFTSPFRVKCLRKILNTFKEIDTILGNNNGDMYRKTNILYINLILLSVINLLIFDICVEYNQHIENYLVFYFLYFIVFVIEVQYGHIIISIKRRFGKLNDFLQPEIFLNHKNTNFNPALKNNSNIKNRIFTVSHNIKDEISAKESLNDLISNLIYVHSKLYELIDLFNENYGLLALIIIVSCLFHLVTTPYFLLIDILGENSSTTSKLILQFFWIIAHVTRLLIIVEPCQSASDEAANTNPLVAKLLATDLDNRYKNKLYMFSLQLIHREVEFTAYDLCKINRSLLSAVTGAITTYLVILLQFR